MTALPAAIATANQGPSASGWSSVPLLSASPTIGNLTSAALVDPTPAGYQWRYEGTESGRYLGLLDDGTFELVHEASITDFQSAVKSAPYLAWALPDLPSADWGRYRYQVQCTIVSQSDVANNAVVLALGNSGLTAYGAVRSRPSGSATHAADRTSHGANAAMATGLAGVVGTLRVDLSNTLSGGTNSYLAALRDEAAVTTMSVYTGIACASTGNVVVVAYKANGTGGTAVISSIKYRLLDTYQEPS